MAEPTRVPAIGRPALQQFRDRYFDDKAGQAVVEHKMEMFASAGRAPRR